MRLKSKCLQSGIEANLTSGSIVQFQAGVSKGRLRNGVVLALESENDGITDSTVKFINILFQQTQKENSRDDVRGIKSESSIVTNDDVMRNSLKTDGGWVGGVGE